MKIRGDWETRKVWVDGRLLSPRRSQKLYNHSPDGFNWGYGGSGPAQLALAILLLVCDDDNEAVRLHQEFKWHFVSNWPKSDFEADVGVNDWVEMQRRARV